MVSKFLIAIAGIIVVMAVLVAIPSIGSQNTPQLKMNYVRDHITELEGGIVDITTREVLRIENDGSATYTKTDYYPSEKTDERKFSLSNDEMKRLRGLIFETGFMQIPVEHYSEKEELTNYTRYQVAVYQGDDSQKIITWFNPEASEVPVPSIITNIGSQLDTIIGRHV
jgi:hypothetical protein